MAVATSGGTNTNPGGGSTGIGTIISEPVGFGISSASKHKDIQNNPQDVSAVQDALNQIPASQGGAATPLAVTGIVLGPSDPTVLAIRRFQRRNFGWEDGVVDPGNKTETRMVQLLQNVPGGGTASTNGQPTVSIGPNRPLGSKSFLLTQWMDDRTNSIKKDLTFGVRKYGGLDADGSVAATILRGQQPDKHMIGNPLLLGDSVRGTGPLGLEDDHRFELGNIILGGSVGDAMIDAFIANTIKPPLLEMTFPGLDSAVANAPTFLAAAQVFENQIKANLKAQAQAGLVDYRDLVTGSGPNRGTASAATPSPPPIPATEPGKLTTRQLPSLTPPLVKFNRLSELTCAACLGGVQGVKVSLLDFKVTGPQTVYNGTLLYELFDHFGIDDDDCEGSLPHGTQGQKSFWVLQHHHNNPGHMPFITVVSVERKFFGVL